MSDFQANKRTERAMRKIHDSAAEKNDKSHFGSKPLTHGGGAAGLSWIGAGLFVIGIVLGAASGSSVLFWVFGGLAVQLWIVGAIIRPIEAIFTLLNERIPKSPEGRVQSDSE